MLGLPPALTVRQILAIDMGIDILPALALGIEKPEPDIMQRPPRPRSRPLLDRGLLLRSFVWLGLIEAALCYAGFLSVYLFSGNGFLLGIPFLNQYHFPILFTITGDLEAMARAVFLTGVAMAQIGNAFACRTSRARNIQMGWTSNRNLIASMALTVLIILAMVYFPPLARGFNNEAFPTILWYFLPFYALVIYGLEWIRKSLVRRTAKNKGQ
jgi:P-type Ca2+ transporter type 2C